MEDATPLPVSSSSTTFCKLLNMCTDTESRSSNEIGVRARQLKCLVTSSDIGTDDQ